jgi:hypothetical protein
MSWYNCESEYSPNEDKIFVYLNRRLLPVIEDIKYRDRLSKELKRCFVHENAHRQQHQLNFFKVETEKEIKRKETVKKELLSRGRSPTEEDLSMPSKYYLSLNHEVDARAADIAENLHVTSGNDAIKKIERRNDPSSTITKEDKEIISYYFDIGGKTLRRFLDAIWRYYEEPVISGGVAEKNEYFSRKR